MAVSHGQFAAGTGLAKAGTAETLQVDQTQTDCGTCMPMETQNDGQGWWSAETPRRDIGVSQPICVPDTESAQSPVPNFTALANPDPAAASPTPSGPSPEESNKGTSAEPQEGKVEVVKDALYYKIFGSTINNVKLIASYD